MSAEDYRDQHTYTVYRCYDAQDRLLYIGCTQDMTNRMAVHAADLTNPASRVVGSRTVLVETEEVVGYSAASRAEREAIFNEAPLFNLHHQKAKRAAAERNAAIDAYMEETRPKPNPERAAQLAKIFERFAS